LEAIIFNDKELLIPVKNDLKKILKIFYYTKNRLDNTVIKKTKKIAPDLIKETDSCFLYYFQEPKIETKLTCHNIYLKMITERDSLAKFPKGIDYYGNLIPEAQQRFSSLGQESDLGGFSFLWKEFIAKNKPLSPIICAVEQGEIIGAIGPLDISKDAWGTLWLLPPYFGIKKKARREGYGSKLWQAAMNFAHQRGAQYTLVQSRADSPAARFYEKQGLTKTSETYSLPLE